jgi:hypothetical protein
LRHLLTSTQFAEEYVEIHIPKRCGALQTRRKKVKEHKKNKGGRFSRGKKTIALDLASNSPFEVNIKKPCHDNWTRSMKRSLTLFMYIEMNIMDMVDFID